MRRWLILIAFGLATLPVLGQTPAAPPVLTTPPTAATTDATPALADAPIATTPDATPAPLAPSEPLTPAIHPAGKILNDGSIQDSLGFIALRPVPDSDGTLPLFLQRVNYLRAHGDDILAISYLRDVVTKGDVAPQYRARAMLQLADCLDAEHREAESLCWLKIWMELYPARPEIGAVAYRIGSMYMQMGLADPARDAFYLALAHSINDGQVHTPDDLKLYTELTVGTLWGLASNEYQSGQWQRAAELFARYRRECPTASPLSMEKAAYLQADCYYQLKQGDKAVKLYVETLAQHPFNPLAPQARLRLYHLYFVRKQPELARDELESLAWTVRTVFPKDEPYWQKQTAQLLLDLNRKNLDILPPLVQVSAALPPEGKSWQEALNHYDALVSLQTATANANMDRHTELTGKAASARVLPEQVDLREMERNLNQLLPDPQTASTQ